MRSLTTCFLAMVTMFLVGCGSSGSSKQTPSGTPLSGNWQFSLSVPADGSFSFSGSGATSGGSGGFLLQNGNSVSGSISYLIFPGTSQGNPYYSCAGGAAQVTGTVNGQNVSFSVSAGQQTFSLSGTLSNDGSTMAGTYSSTNGGVLPNGTSQGLCGTQQSGVSWSARLVPPLSGMFQGNIHSASGTAFAVSGTLTQGENIGADHATITGSISTSGYPCFSSASLTGTITGNSVVLSIITPDGLTAGQIGGYYGDGSASTAQFQNAVRGNGMVLLATSRRIPGYEIGSTNTCKGVINQPGDQGNICLSLGTATACSEPMSLSPNILTFPAALVGSTSAPQTITLTNTDPLGSTQNLSLSFYSSTGDISGGPNFTEQDTCGASFSLAPNQSCTVTVNFTPQQSCPADPTVVSPLKCPVPVTASLQITSDINVDGDSLFAAAITGTGNSAIVPSLAELDYGPEANGESSDPQSVTFTNQSQSPIQILPSANIPCVYPPPRPLVPGIAPGLQVVFDRSDITVSGCDTTSNPPPTPSLPITNDACSGTLLQPQQSCTVTITYSPQPSSTAPPPAPYFLELNTLQCISSVTQQCELDAGRFPVTLIPSESDLLPLRFRPAAGLDFGTQAVGTSSRGQTITVFNDPTDPNAGPLTLGAAVPFDVAAPDFSVTTTCGLTLAAGQSCALSVVFTPTAAGLRQGTIAISKYDASGYPMISLRGRGH